MKTDWSTTGIHTIVQDNLLVIVWNHMLFATVLVHDDGITVSRYTSGQVYYRVHNNGNYIMYSDDILWPEWSSQINMILTSMHKGRRHVRYPSRRRSKYLCSAIAPTMRELIKKYADPEKLKWAKRMYWHCLTMGISFKTIRLRNICQQLWTAEAREPYSEDHLKDIWNTPYAIAPYLSSNESIVECADWRSRVSRGRKSLVDKIIPQCKSWDSYAFLQFLRPDDPIDWNEKMKDRKFMRLLRNLVRQAPTRQRTLYIMGLLLKDDDPFKVFKKHKLHLSDLLVSMNDVMIEATQETAEYIMRSKTLNSLINKVYRYHRILVAERIRTGEWHKFLSDEKKVFDKIGWTQPEVSIPLPDGFKQLRTKEEFDARSEEQRHCVAMYFNRTLKGETLIVTCDKGDKQATVEVRCNKDHMYVTQSYGKENCQNTHTESCKMIITEWVSINEQALQIWFSNMQCTYNKAVEIVRQEIKDEADKVIQKEGVDPVRLFRPQERPVPAW